MYRGNLSDNQPVFRLPQEAESVWIHLVRYEWDDNHVPKKFQKTQAYSQQDWRNMQNMESRFGISWLKAATWQEFTVLHDPSLPYDLEELKIKES